MTPHGLRLPATFSTGAGVGRDSRSRSRIRAENRSASEWGFLSRAHHSKGSVKLVREVLATGGKPKGQANDQSQAEKRNHGHQASCHQTRLWCW